MRPETFCLGRVEQKNSKLNTHLIEGVEPICGAKVLRSHVAGRLDRWPVPFNRRLPLGASQGGSRAAFLYAMLVLRCVISKSKITRLGNWRAEPPKNGNFVT